MTRNVSSGQTYLELTVTGTGTFPSARWKQLKDGRRRQCLKDTTARGTWSGEWWNSSCARLVDAASIQSTQRTTKQAVGYVSGARRCRISGSTVERSGLEW